jgi:hypothetical protein
MTNSTGFTNLAAVEASTEKTPLVGYTVFWGLAGIRVNRDDLERALDQAGLIEFLPKAPSPRVALRRALEHWLANRKRFSNQPGAQATGDDTEEERTLIRVINRSGSDHLVFALVAENVDFASLGLNYGTSLRILLHKKTGEMIVTTEASGMIDALHESRQLAAELAPYWQEYKDKFIARDLSQMMREIIDRLNATSLRRAGGVYFVPATEREPLGRLRDVIERLPRAALSDPFVCALGIPQAEETRKGLAQAVHAGMMDEIISLRADLDRLGESSGAVREKTIAGRLIHYKRLRAKAEIYKDLLDMQQDQVRAAIGELEQEARNLLTLDEEPYPAPTAQIIASMHGDGLEAAA